MFFFLSLFSHRGKTNPVFHHSRQEPIYQNQQEIYQNRPETIQNYPIYSIVNKRNKNVRIMVDDNHDNAEDKSETGNNSEGTEQETEEEIGKTIF